MYAIRVWNSKRSSPFAPDQLQFLWGAELLDINDEEVRLFDQKDVLERSTCLGSAPVLGEVSVPEEKVKRALRNLLK